MTPTTVTLALTGACAAAYTLRLFQCCLQNNIHVQFITSQPGQSVAARWTARLRNWLISASREFWIYLRPTTTWRLAGGQ
jgi:3-polyprenyl-4-hydroxybenzoate decarboxylase